MGDWPILDTPRLILRGWRPEDRAPFAALNADPEVMRFFPAPLDRAASDAMVDRIELGFAAHGWGLHAVSERESGAFIGFVGLSQATFEAPFTPCTEIGWRLARWAWGRGYATEAAQCVLRRAFGVHGLEAVYSFTTETNTPSRRVMEKLGLSRAPELDFDHPRTPGWWGRRHVVYCLRPPERPAPGERP